MKEKNNIEKELREAAPRLAQREKKNPFSVPENYFGESVNKIIAAIKEERVETELEGTTHLKSHHAAKDTRVENQLPDVPVGYFESLPEKILEKITEEKKPAVAFNIRNYFRSSSYRSGWLAATAIAAALVITFFILKPEGVTTIQDKEFIALSLEEIQNYVNANIASFNEQTIEDQISGDNLFDEIENIDLKATDLSLTDLSQIDLTTIQNL